MKSLNDIIAEMSDNYLAERHNLPCDLEAEMLLVAGVGEGDKYHMVYIPAGSEHMGYTGSNCGKAGNRVFSAKKLKSFLKRQKVGGIVGIIVPSDDDLCSDGCIALSAVALPLAGKPAQKFEDIASSLGGSFRLNNEIKGWSVYESE